MLLKFQRDPPWLESLNNREFAGGCVICLQGGSGDPVAVPHGGDHVAVPQFGDQVLVPHVSVPAALLAAISPVVRKILLTDYLLPQYPPVIFIPSVSAKVLKIVVELLLTGKASESLDVTRMSEIQNVFKMMRIEACLTSSQLQSRCLEDTVEEDEWHFNVVENKVDNTKDVSKRDKDHENVKNTKEEDAVQHFEIEIILKTEANSEDCYVVGNKVENFDINTEDVGKRDKDLHVDVVNTQHQILTNNRLRSDAGQSECNENNPNVECIENNLNVEQVEQLESSSERSKSRPEPELSTTQQSLPRSRRNTRMEVSKQSTETEQGKKNSDESLPIEDLEEISESKVCGVKETGSRYPRRDRLKSSAKVHFDQRAKTSDKISDKRFNRISQLKDHAVIHNVEVPSLAKPKQCSICEEMFSNNSDLKRHVRVVHSKPKPHICQVCGYQASRRHHLQVHVRQHTGDKPFPCDKCEYETGIPHNLRGHKISHTGGKPFQCDKCDYKTEYPANLRRHKLRHTGKKPHKCPHCEYETGITGISHTPFHCDQCDYKTGYPADLRRHTISHTGDKPFHCDQCDYKTGYFADLRIHKISHTGDKPFQCDKCDYKTVYPSDLRRHKLMHTGEKPHICPHCQYSAIQSSHLKYHLKSQHPEKPQVNLQGKHVNSGNKVSGQRVAMKMPGVVLGGDVKTVTSKE